LGTLNPRLRQCLSLSLNPKRKAQARKPNLRMRKIPTAETRKNFRKVPRLHSLHRSWKN
jgi:hypothetical protein